jgi:hypothetical protein
VKACQWFWHSGRRTDEFRAIAWSVLLNVTAATRAGTFPGAGLTEQGDDKQGKAV